MAKDETGLLSSAKQPSSEAGYLAVSPRQAANINEDKDTHVLTWLQQAARKFPATFGATCTAIAMGITGVILLATGTAYAQTVTLPDAVHAAHVRTVALTARQPSWWHARHLAHLAHLARLAELAREAEYAQKLAAEKTTLAASAALPQHTAATTVNTLTYQGSTSMQQCIISRESGGNPYIWNASGHWGLYQFSYGTWVAHGGAPGDFGHAGPATQTAVFWQTVHDDGYSDWAPYDGC